MTEPTRKDGLLAAAVDYVSAHRIGDLSLRHLAAALGTSHRMLIYHFGSKEGLLTEVIRVVEERQRQALAALEASRDRDPLEVMRLMWQLRTDPAARPLERLHLELTVQAAQGRLTTGLEDVAVAWREPMEALLTRAGVPPRDAAAEARLFIAVAQGLILELLTTDDLVGIDQAYERFISRYA